MSHYGFHDVINFLFKFYFGGDGEVARAEDRKRDGIGVNGVKSTKNKKNKKTRKQTIKQTTTITNPHNFSLATKEWILPLVIDCSNQLRDHFANQACLKLCFFEPFLSF